MEINHLLFIPIHNWSNLVEIKTSGVHDNLDDWSIICNGIRPATKALWHSWLAGTFRLINLNLARTLYSESGFDRSKHIDVRFIFSINVSSRRDLSSIRFRHSKTYPMSLPKVFWQIDSNLCTLKWAWSCSEIDELNQLHYICPLQGSVKL